LSKIKKEYYNFNASELIDLLSNLQIKETKFVKSTYTKELKKVLADIDLILKDKKIKLSGKILRKIIFVGISNLLVWEFKDMMLKDKKNYNSILKNALRINSIRNNTTNSLMKDFKEFNLTKKRITEFTKNDLKWVSFLKKKLDE
tara:strand:+ start:9747 stop:10181 length:435 start_codon:yes stop_codon:yes gene_type:complete